MRAEYAMGFAALGFILGFVIAELGAVSPCKGRSDRKRPPAPSNPRKLW